MKIPRLLFIFLFISAGNAQSISSSVINPAGKTQVQSNFKISWALGEPVAGIMASQGMQLSNGYYPSLDLDALSREEKDLSAVLDIYPNPVTDFIIIKNNNKILFGIKIISQTGQVIKQENSNDTNIILNMYGMPAGVYFLVVNNDTNKINTYKIIKK